MEEKINKVIEKLLDVLLVELEKETTPSAETLEMVKIALSYADTYKEKEKEVVLELNPQKVAKQLLDEIKIATTDDSV